MYRSFADDPPPQRVIEIADHEFAAHETGVNVYEIHVSRSQQTAYRRGMLHIGFVKIRAGGKFARAIDDPLLIQQMNVLDCSCIDPIDRARQQPITQPDHVAANASRQALFHESVDGALLAQQSGCVVYEDRAFETIRKKGQDGLGALRQRHREILLLDAREPCVAPIQDFLELRRESVGEWTEKNQVEFILS